MRCPQMYFHVVTHRTSVQDVAKARIANVAMVRDVYYLSLLVSQPISNELYLLQIQFMQRLKPE